MVSRIFGLLVLGAVLVAGCSDEATPYFGPDSGTDGDADGDADGDTDSDTDADADADTDADTDSDADTDADTDADADGDADADADSDADSDSDSDTGTGTNPCPDDQVLGCNAGDAWCVDELTDDPQSLYDDCTGGEFCVESEGWAECQCILDWYDQCHNGDVWSFDSCDGLDSLVEDCDNLHGTCADTSATTAECGCMPNWDPAEGCDACLPGWAHPDCDVCVRYVDATSTVGTPDGLSWSTAFATVQPAINAARTAVLAVDGPETCEVWVAAGRYYVYQTAVGNTILLASDVHVYGGFEGDETLRDQRDWDENLTILDGRNALSGPNRVYHVMTGANDAIVDGFVVTGGNAVGAAPHNQGGGLYLRPASMEARNSVFVGNHANYLGGGIALDQASEISVSGCLFAGNTVTLWGGAMSVFNGGNAEINRSVFTGNVGGTASSVETQGGGVVVLSTGSAQASFENCVFVGNRGLERGGVSFGYQSVDDYQSCTFFGNSAPIHGAITKFNIIGTTTVNGCVVWGNGATPIIATSTTATYSDIEGGFTGAGNINADPVFAGGPYAVGTWTTVSFDAAAVQSVLFDQEAGFADGELVGMFVRPDTSDPKYYPVVSNAGNEVRVWGDVTAFTAANDSYSVVDLHLDDGSPCIDAADGNFAPEFDFDGNPRVDDPATTNTGIGTTPYADMGAYEFQS